MRERHRILLLILLSLILFTWKINSTPILDGDTAFWAKIAKTMLETGNWLTLKYIHPGTVIERGPLMPWLMAASFKIFGINELALSLWHSFMALGTVLLTYFIGRELFGSKTGFISALILLTSAQFFYQGRSPLQDMPLTFFITAALYLFLLFDKRKNYFFYYLAPVFVALAVLTKGPVGLVLTGLILLIYLLFSKKLLSYLNWHILGALFVFFLMAAPWYIAEYQILGPPFLKALVGNNLGRFFMPTDLIGKPSAQSVIQPQYDFYSYFLQLFLLFVPWSGFLYPAVYRCFRVGGPSGPRTGGPKGPSTRFIISWAAAIILFFSLSLNYKISRYILPAFPALALLVGRMWEEYLDGHKVERLMRTSNWLNILLVIPLLFVGTLYLIFNFPAEQAAYRPMIIPLLAILSAGMLISSLLLFMKKPRASFISFVSTALIGYLVLIPLVSIHFKEANPTKYLSLKLNRIAQPHSKIIKYKGFEDHLMIFYLDHPMLTIEKESELIKYLRSSKAYVVCEDPKAVENLKYPVKILERKSNFVLFTNK